MRAPASIGACLGTHFYRFFRVLRGIGRMVGIAVRSGFRGIGGDGELALQHDVEMLEPVEGKPPA